MAINIALANEGHSGGVTVPGFRVLRISTARLLVNLNFVWPFINASYFGDSTLETNFIPVFIAAMLVPEVLFEDSRSLILSGAIILLAAFAAPPGSYAWLRLVIAVIPTIFLIGFYRYLSRSNRELISISLVELSLLGFLGLSIIQFVDFKLIRIIPDWFTRIMSGLVPRYMQSASDVRGVSGWASEPATAALMCFAFATVLIQNEPRKRLRVFLLFGLLTFLNKSLYSLALLTYLVLIQVAVMRRRVYAIVFLVVALFVGLYVVHSSARVAELEESFFTDLQFSETDSPQLQRIAQIVFPLMSFPRIYEPIAIYADQSYIVQPLGLLPLLVGYGSLLGCFLYYRLIFRMMPPREANSKLLALLGILVLSLWSPPNFVPSIIAFIYCLKPGTHETRTVIEKRKGILPALLSIRPANFGQVPNA